MAAGKRYKGSLENGQIRASDAPGPAPLASSVGKATVPGCPEALNRRRVPPTSRPYRRTLATSSAIDSMHRNAGATQPNCPPPPSPHFPLVVVALCT